MKNPYPNSEDNKRYQSWNYYCKKHYGQRLYKVPLDAGFSCPNRDGTVAFGGCVFCSGGSSSFPQDTQDDLWQQFLERKTIFERKWPDGRALAYFQSYSNTHASARRLKQLYSPFLESSEVQGLVISTRSDCLSDEVLDYLKETARQKELWIELGLQSIHDRTLHEMNRGHDFQSVLEAIDKLRKAGCRISIHLING